MVITSIRKRDRVNHESAPLQQPSIASELMAGARCAMHNAHQSQCELTSGASQCEHRELEMLKICGLALHTKLLCFGSVRKHLSYSRHSASKMLLPLLAKCSAHACADNVLRPRLPTSIKKWWKNVGAARKTSIIARVATAQANTEVQGAGAEK